MLKQAIILAAGFGSRLQSQHTLKPLIEIDGKALILRTLETLESAGCDEIVITVGYKADRIKRYLSKHYTGACQLNFAFNDQYHLGNGLSVLSADAWIRDRFILSMADHLFSREIPHILRSASMPERGAALLVDYKIDEVFDLDDATKVLTNGDHIVKIGKALREYNCIDTGLFLCSRDLMAALKQVVAEKGDASLSEGIALLGSKGIMRAIDIGDATWQDIDDPDMLEQGWKMLNCEPT